MRVESKGWGKRGSRVRGFTTGSKPLVAMKLWLAALDVFGDDHACSMRAWRWSLMALHT